MSADEGPSINPEELRERINSLIARYKETCSSESLDELFEVLLIASANLPDRAHVLASSAPFGLIVSESEAMRLT
jgi:hypothetical protein